MQKQLTVLCSMATRHILAELAPEYRRRTGIEVVVRSMGGVELAKLIRAGEQCDLVSLAGDVLTRLESEGHLLAHSVRPFAWSGIGVAIREGAPKPDIKNAAAVRAAMLNATRIGYSSGPSGDYLRGLWQTWGIAEIIEPKSIKPPPGVPVARLLASGEVDLGFQQLSELMGEPDIEIIGELPPDIQLTTTFSIGISSAAEERGAAQELIAFLTSDAATAAKIAHGMKAPPSAN